ncbi:MAG: peptidoglycan-associated lipoprotein [Deltaproteobacteria bacterium RBG_19FT_COMBO_46_9]|jgi:peptidoglycan-associated lipoprotein|nr:MAG: peptidoglycan-associated lipoprotein [Deltaproteobacteria bacterium RBG_19FT_COMBO_46_9]
MKRTIIILLVFGFVLSSFLFTASCAKKQVKEQAPVIDTSAADRERAAKEAAERAAREAAEKERLAKEAAERAAREAAERAAREAAEKLRQEISAFESQNIFFDYDKAELKPEARDILTRKAAFLQANSDYNIRIEGHCDERGTNEYNLALGERRATAASKFISALGVSQNRISTVSYGEERPVDAGHNEDAWSKNRRDEFKLIK